jgi:hypothetical protein
MERYVDGIYYANICNKCLDVYMFLGFVHSRYRSPWTYRPFSRNVSLNKKLLKNCPLIAKHTACDCL